MAADRYKYKKALVSAMALICYILFSSNARASEDSALPAGGSNVRCLIAQSEYKENMTDIVSSILPEDINIIQAYNGTKPGLIIHIQDCHADMAAQKSIAKFLKSVQSEHNVSLLCLEGASKDIDTTYYDGFPSGDIKQKAAMFFLEQGLFTGAEYFKVLNNDQHILACGVEDSRIYIEHRASYKKHKRYQDNVVSRLEVFNKALEAIKEYTLSPDLIELYAKKRSYDNGDIALNDYALFIGKMAENKNLHLSIYKSLDFLIKAARIEKNIDFEKAKHERDKIIEVLSKTQTDADLDTLINKGLDFKRKKTGKADFYNCLRDIMINNQGIINMDDYKNLFLYTEYTQLSGAIDNNNLFDEIDMCLNKLKAVYAENETHKTYERYFKYLNLTLDMHRLNITEAGFQELKSLQKTTDLQGIWFFINAVNKYHDTGFYLKDISLSKKISDNAINYYELALKRDAALAANTLYKMAVSGQSSAILIAGGFHTQGIVDVLRKHDISYIVVRPGIGSDNRDDIYDRQMSGRMPSYQAIENFIKSTLSAPLNSGDLAETPHVRDIEKLFEQLTAELANKEIKKPASYTNPRKGINKLAYQAPYTFDSALSVETIRLGEKSCMRIGRLQNSQKIISGSLENCITMVFKGMSRKNNMENHVFGIVTIYPEYAAEDIEELEKIISQRNIAVEYAGFITASGAEAGLEYTRNTHYIGSILHSIITGSEGGFDLFKGCFILRNPGLIHYAGVNKKGIFYRPKWSNSKIIKWNFFPRHALETADSRMRDYVLKIMEKQIFNESSLLLEASRIPVICDDSFLKFCKGNKAMGMTILSEWTNKQKWLLSRLKKKHRDIPPDADKVIVIGPESILGSNASITTREALILTRIVLFHEKFHADYGGIETTERLLEAFGHSREYADNVADIMKGLGYDKSNPVELLHEFLAIAVTYEKYSDYEFAFKAYGEGIAKKLADLLVNDTRAAGLRRVLRELTITAEKPSCTGNKPLASFDNLDVESAIKAFIDNKGKYRNGTFVYELKHEPVLDDEDICYQNLEELYTEIEGLADEINISISGCIIFNDLKDALVMLCANAYDAIASFYDKGTAPSGPPSGYRGKVSLKFAIDKIEGVKYLTIRIRDNGLGKKSADTERKQKIANINEHFYSGGMGRGLNIVKKIIGKEGKVYVKFADKQTLAANANETETKLLIPVKNLEIKKPIHRRKKALKKSDDVKLQDCIDKYKKGYEELNDIIMHRKTKDLTSGFEKDRPLMEKAITDYLQLWRGLSDFFGPNSLVLYPLSGLDVMPGLFMKACPISDDENDFLRGYNMLEKFAQIEGVADLIHRAKSINRIYLNGQINALKPNYYKQAAAHNPGFKKILVLKGFYHFLETDNYAEGINSFLDNILSEVLQAGDRILILDKNDLTMFNNYIKEKNAACDRAGRVRAFEFETIVSETFKSYSINPIHYWDMIGYPIRIFLLANTITIYEKVETSSNDTLKPRADLKVLSEEVIKSANGDIDNLMLEIPGLLNSKGKGRPVAYIIERGNIFGNFAQIVPEKALRIFVDLFNHRKTKVSLILDIGRDELVCLLSSYGMLDSNGSIPEPIKSSQEVLGAEEYEATADSRKKRMEALVSTEAKLSKLKIGSGINIGIIAEPIERENKEEEREFNKIYSEAALRAYGIKVAKIVLDDPEKQALSLSYALYQLAKAFDKSDTGRRIIEISLPAIKLSEQILDKIVKYRRLLTSINRQA
jgi:hypothetical protein